ncbi:MAG: TIGR00730 family Rossman fold protein [Christensenellaceae bacterium]|jgi:uncharacterized protein (TIGR00730 family)
MRICVFGASSTAMDKKYTDAAYHLGGLMAERGIGLVYGGGAQGIMGATARGMTAGGGEVIGVTPKFFDVDGVIYEHNTQFIYTDTMRERKQTMEDLADAFIVGPGGFGTLEEFFEILTLKQLERHAKAIVVLNTDGYYDELLEFIEFAMNEKTIKRACNILYHVCSTPEEALAYIDAYEPPTIHIKKLRDVGENLTYDSFQGGFSSGGAK